MASTSQVRKCAAFSALVAASRTMLRALQISRRSLLPAARRAEPFRQDARNSVFFDSGRPKTEAMRSNARYRSPNNLRAISATSSCRSAWPGIAVARESSLVLKINFASSKFHPANGSYGRECAIPGFCQMKSGCASFCHSWVSNIEFCGACARGSMHARRGIPIRRRVRTVAATKILILDVWARSFVPLSRILDRCAHRAQPVNRQAANTKLCVPHITKKLCHPGRPSRKREESHDPELRRNSVSTASGFSLRRLCENSAIDRRVLC